MDRPGSVRAARAGSVSSLAGPGPGCEGCDTGSGHGHLGPAAPVGCSRSPRPRTDRKEPASHSRNASVRARGERTSRRPGGKPFQSVFTDGEAPGQAWHGGCLGAPPPISEAEEPASIRARRGSRPSPRSPRPSRPERRCSSAGPVSRTSPPSRREAWRNPPRPADPEARARSTAASRT